jgi:cobalamin synthase
MFLSAVAAHAVARGAAVGLMGVAPVATRTGLGADYGQSTTAGKAVIGVLLGLAVAAIVVGRWALPLVAVVFVTVVSVRWLSMRKIGGISGIAAHHMLR